MWWRCDDITSTVKQAFYYKIFRTLADDLRQEINGAHTTYICALYDVRTDTASTSTSHTTTMRFKSRRSVTNLLTILISPQINTTYLTANFFMCVCVCVVMWCGDVREAKILPQNVWHVGMATLLLRWCMGSSLARHFIMHRMVCMSILIVPGTAHMLVLITKVKCHLHIIWFIVLCPPDRNILFSFYSARIYYSRVFGVCVLCVEHVRTASGAPLHFANGSDIA